MSLVSQVSLLAARVAQEFKKVRQEMAALPTGGGGAGGMALSTLQPRPEVGEFVMPFPTNNNESVMRDSGQVVFMPFPLPAGTYDAARVKAKNGSVGAKIRMGVYADNGGAPGALLGQTAALPTEGSEAMFLGVFDVPIVVPAAGILVWVGAVCQGGPVTRPTTQVWNNYAPQPLAVAQSFFSDTHYANVWGPRATGVTGAFPATLTLQPRSAFDDQIPKVQLRRSA